MKFKKVLLIGIGEIRLDPPYWKKIHSLAEKVVTLPRDSTDIQKELSDTDCLLVGFGIKVDKNHFDNAPKLRYLGTLSIAYGTVDVAYAKKKRVTVSNLDGNTTKEAVAEFVFAALLDHIRELERGKKQAREGNYSEAGFSSTEIKNKVFGILGLGRIGSTVANIALSFGAHVNITRATGKKSLRKKDYNIKMLKV